ncbi:MAG: Fic family protein [Alphaproteobacteria bacterium]|nr:Fic family protein [Alphaproteobacteria bacterium]
MVQPLDDLPEVFLSSDDLSSAVSRAVAAGELRQLGPRLYTKNLTDAPEIIIRRNAWPIVAAYAPGALIADRTALENRPAEDGSVFIVAARRRDIQLPGLWIRPRSGPEPMEDDRPFIGGLRLSSPGRAYLDNMAPSRKRGGVSRTLSREELELRLDDIMRRRGVEALNQARDEARRVAPLIGRDEEFAAFDKLVGALLGTRDDNLVSDRARARRTGAPFDPDRIALFEHLHQELQNTALPSRPVAARTGEANASLTFFEAYFSNFIEGTEFEVAEAADIVFNNVIPADRPEDAHDVLGTWRIVSDPVEMARTPQTADTLFDLIKKRHAILMESRRDKLPGAFKQASNRAGQTVFVAPDQVEGTLARGFEFYPSLRAPLARAIYMMFLISEVHPFADGNGRIARIMMNAELVAAGEERIIIPTIFRSNYLQALKAHSLSRHPAPIVRTLDFAQKWVAAISWSDLHHSQEALTRTNAFMDPAAADDAGIRLKIPQAYE